MKLNEKGLTLIELLAVLLLVSIIAGLAWTAIMISFQHTAVETTKTQLQQEANYAVTKITNEHRRNDHYFLRYLNGKLEINACNDALPSGSICSGFQKLTENEYAYSGTINGTKYEDWLETTTIEPKKTHVNFIMKVADPANPNRSVEVKTTLTRILTNLK